MLTDLDWLGHNLNDKKYDDPEAGGVSCQFFWGRNTKKKMGPRKKLIMLTLETKQKTTFSHRKLMNLLVESSDQTSTPFGTRNAGAGGERLCLVHCRGDNHVAHHFKPRYWKRSNSDLSLRSSWEPKVPPPRPPPPRNKALIRPY